MRRMLADASAHGWITQAERSRLAREVFQTVNFSDVRAVTAMLAAAVFGRVA